MGKKAFIECTFNRIGEVAVEGHEFKGMACESAMKFIFDKLGKPLKTRKKQGDRSLHQQLTGE